MVSVTSANIDYSKTQDQGQDIRFIDADGVTKLSYEIGSWSEVGTSDMWVKVPRIDAGSTGDHIWMYYNNPTTGDGQDAANVWDANYEAVWHLEEDPGPGGAGDIKDATSHANHGTADASMTAGDQVTGMVGGSLDFDGNNDYVSMANDASLKPTQQVTISMWIKRQGSQGTYAKLGWFGQNSSDPYGPYGLRFNQDANDNIQFHAALDGSDRNTDTGAIINNGVWYHVVGVYDQSNIIIYVDGAQKSTASYPGQTITDYDTTNGFAIGDDFETGQPFDGQIDEVRVSSIGRSAYWVEAQYKSMTLTFNTFGPEQVAGYYDLKKNIVGDGAATTITATFSPGQTGRVMPSPDGKFAHPLTGVSEMPASIWNVTYRVKNSDDATLTVHADMDLLIRKADGSVRTTLDTNVANTSNVAGTTWQSLTAGYTFPGYTVVDQTDYLEIDLFAEATSNSSVSDVTVDFRIDDPILPEADQTRVREDVTLPEPPPSPPTLYVVDGASDEVYKYSDDGIFLGSSSLDSDNSSVRGITTTGDSNFWTTDSDDDAYKYTFGFSLVTQWGQAGANGNATGITTDKTNIWIVDYRDDAVYKYTMSGGYVSSFELTSANSRPRGITTDGINIWVVDYSDDEVYKYDMSGSFVSSFSLTSGNGNARGITTDGSNIWVVDRSSDDIYKYDMNGAFIVSFTLVPTNGYPEGITVAPR